MKVDFTLINVVSAFPIDLLHPVWDKKASPEHPSFFFFFLPSAEDPILLQSGSHWCSESEVPGPGCVYVGSYMWQTVCLGRQRSTPEDVRAICRRSEVKPGLKHDDI